MASPDTKTTAYTFSPEKNPRLNNVDKVASVPILFV
jgi:hypothetical protein